MYTTLKTFLTKADDLQNYLEKYGYSIKSSQIENKISEIQSDIKLIQNIVYQMAHVSNTATKILMKKKTYKNLENIPNDPLPNENDIEMIRYLYSEENKEILPKISIPIKYVNTVNDIPISHIYYINKLKQYAINIGGIVIRGSLGNIVKYKDKRTSLCAFKRKCKQINICKYYHDPYDYIENNLEVPQDLCRNFTPGSWIYTSKNKPFMRHIGSIDNILDDLKILDMNSEEIVTREHQLVHDLLIYMILNSKGLLHKYTITRG